MERIAEGAQASVVAKGPTEEFSLAERWLTRATGALALLVVSPLIAFIWVGLKLEQPGSAIALRSVKPGRTKAYHSCLVRAELVSLHGAAVYKHFPLFGTC